MTVPTGRRAYLAAVAAALVAAFSLFFILGAVGVIGAEGDAPDRMFLAVYAVAAVGSLAARFRARGMAWAMGATAVVQVAVGVVAVAGGMVPAYNLAAEVLGLVGGFGAMWAGVGVAVRPGRRAGAGVAGPRWRTASASAAARQRVRGPPPRPRGRTGRAAGRWRGPSGLDPMDWLDLLQWPAFAVTVAAGLARRVGDGAQAAGRVRAVPGLERAVDRVGLARRGVGACRVAGGLGGDQHPRHRRQPRRGRRGRPG